MDRREAALEHGAARSQLALLVDGHALRRVVRVRHDDLRDARGERGLDRRVDLGAAEVARREHEVVAGDDREHAREAVRRDAHGLAADAGGRELVLDLAPDRLLGRLRAVLARLVLGVDGRQPDDARTAARGDLDRLRVQPADPGVERDRAERVARRAPRRARRPRAPRSARSAT